MFDIEWLQSIGVPSNDARYDRSVKMVGTEFDTRTLETRFFKGFLDLPPRTWAVPNWSRRKSPKIKRLK